MLSDNERNAIAAELENYPSPEHACIDALRIVQRQRGWVSDEGVQDIAAFLQMSAAEVDSVATFYNLIFRRPVGKHVIFLCDSVSCWIVGYERIREQLSAELGINFGETTADGQFTLLPIPCLGTCDHAPAMMIDEDLHRDLRPEQIGDILSRYQSNEGS